MYCATTLVIVWLCMNIVLHEYEGVLNCIHCVLYLESMVVCLVCQLYSLNYSNG